MENLVAIAKLIMGVYLEPGQTELKEYELEELRQAFHFFDSDDNGSVTKAELKAVLKTIGHHPTDADIDKMVGDVDLDGNGEIDFNEFLAMMAKQLMTQDSPDELREAFKVFDKDGDGFLSPQEFRHIMTQLGEKFSDSECDEMMKAADTNGDEFVKLMTS